MGKVWCHFGKLFIKSETLPAEKMQVAFFLPKRASVLHDSFVCLMPQYNFLAEIRMKHGHG
ncbi:hypothetical protein TI10_15405 [Photorhabdus luminescens subsp. luminescens]|nr:hypothetical protein TI10_15405 [Photorhabdus luminescens subsp. luminescens]